MSISARIVVVLAGLALGASAVPPAKPVSYTRDVRPILSENCFFCHGQDPNHRKAGLRLDTQDGQRGKNGVVPGHPEKSDVVRRILTDDEDDQMPPAKSNRHLTSEQREILKRWVAEGAKFEAHWAFVAPTRPVVPAMEGAINPIDNFILARLTERGLAMSPEAPKEALIRRVALDLTGLPPTPAEVEAFVKDQSPGAYERMVDRLLASPHYGERMALPWLDAARYADSNGFQQDGDTYQWVWRDWLVKALNDNMPFDQFTIEQLAGDLLEKPTQAQMIATAFNRNHLLNGEGGAIPEEQRNVILFDRVDVTATNWLGLTVACAQCHDHKYDPITMRDYYSLMAGFNKVPESGTPGGSRNRIRVADPTVEVVSAEDKARAAELEKKSEALRAKLNKVQEEWRAKTAAEGTYADKEILELTRQTSPENRGRREKALREHFEAKVAPKVAKDLLKESKDADKAINDFKAENYPRVMVMSDARPRDTFVLDRGNYLSPTKDKVEFATPGFLPPMPKDWPRSRLGLAKWLVSPEQPLMARVIVNRMWQTIMGTGLVKTAEDFGVQGDVPVHQDLLDWLAVEFRESGWDVKRIYRLIVTSRTYRQSSKVTPALLAADPENKLYARATRYRHASMTLRDMAVATSGLLTDKVGGKPVYPYQPDGIWEALAITKERDFTYPQSTGPELYRRSLYTFWRRTVGPANMFDASNRQACRVRASTTNTPLHALTTLNDVTWVEASRVLAAKVMGATGDDARLTEAFKRVLTRSPGEGEMATLRRMLAKQREHFATRGADATKLVSMGATPRDEKADVKEHAAWTAVCLALFNLDEALTRE
ncbi:MAG TPA: PSD1 and planctomycete cytochrome C domain-containing protein [Tepidisphaeraceae bacterium]|nr:PSD1 and planctomycete cytochrome C domain-containing protein [Tepidisphaeraceae bacterium]